MEGKTKRKRDDFSSQIKKILCDNVGGKCSNPSCKKETKGPNEKINKNTVIGIASHICAASKGGPRYDESMCEEERKSISNGIWLCNVCAKLIDVNPHRYTPQLLRKWKADAEFEQSKKIGIEYKEEKEICTEKEEEVLKEINKELFDIEQIITLAKEIYEINFIGKDEWEIENELEECRNLYEYDIEKMSEYPKVRDKIFNIRRDNGLLLGIEVEDGLHRLFKKLEFQFISGAFGAETYLSNFMICVHKNYNEVKEILKQIKISIFNRYNKKRSTQLIK